MFGTSVVVMGAEADEQFDQWYRARRPRILGALTLLASHDLAVEATDEAFVRAYERWPRVAAMTNPTGWVYRIAVNQMKRLARRRSLERRLSIRSATAHPPPDEAGSHLGNDSDLWRAVRALPERQKMAFVLRYVADLPEKDVAAIMGVTRGAVSSAASKARSHLAESLGDQLRTEVPE